MNSTECRKGVCVCVCGIKSCFLVLLVHGSLSCRCVWLIERVSVVCKYIVVRSSTDKVIESLESIRLHWLFDWLYFVLFSLSLSLIRPSVLCTLLPSKRFAQLTKKCSSHAWHVKVGWLLENGENRIVRFCLSQVYNCYVPPLFHSRSALIGSFGCQSLMQYIVWALLVAWFSPFSVSWW